MKTNISELMNIIADEEKKFTNITSHIEEMIFNETIIELDGTANVIKDYKKDFDEALMEQENILKKISKLKATLYEKNNSFKLSDGRTIQVGSPYWVKVEPIKWMIDEKANIALSKKLIFKKSPPYKHNKSIYYTLILPHCPVSRHRKVLRIIKFFCFSLLTQPRNADRINR